MIRKKERTDVIPTRAEGSDGAKKKIHDAIRFLDLARNDNNRLPRRMRLLAMMLGVILVLTGCIRDVDFGGDPQTGENLETLLTLQVPTGGFNPATRTLSSADENAITEVDVLVFRRETDNSEVFFHRAQTDLVGDAGTDNDGNPKRSFRISVKKSERQLQFVVIANSRELIESKKSILVEGALRADVLKELVREKTTAWSAGTATANTGYDPLPMWGQTGFRTITDAASAAATIDMIRTHARIDVTVSSSAQADFALTGVWLYNASTKGQVTPVGTWTSGTAVYPDGGRAASSASFAYTEMTTAGKALTGMIYTFESPAVTANTQTDGGAYLVVRGSWNGEADSYYRVDFHDGTTFMPLLRNHHYEVDITRVSGRGYPQASEAAAAGFTSLTATTHQWAQGKMGSVVWDGRDWLAVSETGFNIYPEEQQHTVKIATTYSSGWKAEVKTDAADETNWLTIVGSDSGTGNAANPPIGSLTFHLTENTQATASRTGRIVVSAGRLQQTITVVQNRNKELSLEVGDVEMIFSATAPQSTPLRVEWKPGARDCAVTTRLVPITGGGNYTQLSFTGANALAAVTDPSNEGATNYAIKPDAFTPSAADPFQERRSTLVIKADDGATPTPNTIEKTVLLRQFNYAVRVAASGHSYLTGNGITTGAISVQQNASYSFLVRSNGEWRAEVSDSDGVLASWTTPVGEPDTTGEIFTFTASDISKAGKSATITIKSTATPAQFADYVMTVTMQKNDPNCYMVVPGAPQDIPIAKVFDVWANDNDLNNAARGGDPSAMTSGNYTAELLWQDNKGLISSVTLPAGATRTSKITVQTTAGENGGGGNAVVVLKEGTAIRWSWHLWVTDYDPDAGQNGTTYIQPRNKAVYMDRNLGAAAAVPASSASNDIVKTYGLLYQHGRKDPFPGPRATTGVTNTYNSKYIYNAAGDILTEGTSAGTGHTSGTGVKREPTTVAVNLANAVYNPLTLYWGAYDGVSVNIFIDWYKNTSLSTGARTDLWGDYYKSDFDPCPDGWKVPDRSQRPFDYTEPVSIANGGFTLHGIGFIPAQGLRTITIPAGTSEINPELQQGQFSAINYSSYLWLSGSYTGQGHYDCHLGNTVISTTNTYAAQAFPVRCVRVE